MAAAEKGLELLSEVTIRRQNDGTGQKKNYEPLKPIKIK
jgi:hypothetical protein